MATGQAASCTYEEEDEGITRAVKSLDDVLTRLAMAKDENLPRIAPRLLPSLLEQLSSKHAAVRNKAMQVLSHLNVRIRDDERVLLPTAQLLALLVKYAPKTSTDSGVTTTTTTTTGVSSSLVASTALVYVTKAAERCSDEELVSCCGKLLEACTVVQISHDAPAGSIGGELRRLLALSVAKLRKEKDMAWKRKRPRSKEVGNNEGEGSLTTDAGSEDDVSGLTAALEKRDARALFLKFAKCILLFEPLLSQPNDDDDENNGDDEDEARAAAETEAALAAEAATNAAGLNAPAPINGGNGGGGGGGLPSAIAARRLFGPRKVKRAPGGVQGGLAPKDLEWLRSLKRDFVPAMKLGILHVLQSRYTVQEALVLFTIALSDSIDEVRLKAEDLLRRPTDPPNFSDPKVLRDVMAVFHGTMPTEKNVPAALVVPPASPALRQKIVSAVLLRSIAAASLFPQTLQTIYACIFGEDTVARLRQLGVELAVWTFRHAKPDALGLMAPLIVRGITKLLGIGVAPEGDEAAASTADDVSRNFCYQAIEQLAYRLPTALSTQVDLVEHLFHGLEAKSGASRSYTHDACGAIVASFKGCEGDARTRIEQLILSAVESTHDTARSMAVNWAGKVFPLSNPAARYVCLIAAGDRRHDVASDARRTLFTPQDASTSTFPSRAEMIRFIAEKESARGGIQAISTWTPDAYMSAIRLLSRCKATNDTASVGAYLTVILIGLESGATEAMSRTSLEALMALFSSIAEVDAAARDIAALVSGLKDTLVAALGHESIRCRELAAASLGKLCMLCSKAGIEWDASSLVASLLSTASSSSTPAEIPPPGNGADQGTERRPRRRCRPEGAALALGFIVANSELQTSTGIDTETKMACVKELLSLVASKDKTEAALAAAVALGYVSLCSGRTYFGDITSGEGEDGTHEIGEGDVMETDEPVRATSLKQIIDPFSGLIKDTKVRTSRRAVMAAAYLCWGLKDRTLTDALVSQLTALASVRSEELHVDVGRALGIMYAGPVSVTSHILLSPSVPEGDAQEKAVEDEDSSDASNVATVNATTTMTMSASEKAAAYEAMHKHYAWLNEVQSSIFASVVDPEKIFSPKEDIRQAASSWLVQVRSVFERYPLPSTHVCDILRAAYHIPPSTEGKENNCADIALRL